MAQLLKQSTAFTFRIGPFVDSTDGATAETGLSIAQADIQISKAGGAFAQTSASPTTTHDTDGWYQCPLTATDTNTLGTLDVQVVVSGALPVWKSFMVVPANVFDSLVSGTDTLEVDATLIEGSDATNQINAACDAAIETYSLDGVSAAIAALNDLSAADVNAEVDTALADIHLDHLLAVDTGASLPGASGAILQDLLEDDSGTWRFTTNALEQGPGGGGGSDWTSDEKDEIRYRLGIDGTTSAPASNTPNFGNTTFGDITTGKIVSTSSDSGGTWQCSNDTGNAVGIVTTGTNKHALALFGQGTGAGIYSQGGANGPGIQPVGQGTEASNDIKGTLQVCATVSSLQSSSIPVGAFASGAITAAAIASNAITDAKIASGAITAAKLASSAITADKIASDAITAAKIATGAIASDEIAASAANKIADHVMRRATSNIEGSSDGDTLDDRSLYGAVAGLVHKTDISDGSNLKKYQSDDSTLLVTIPITTSASADPVTVIDPP